MATDQTTGTTSQTTETTGSKADIYHVDLIATGLLAVLILVVGYRVLSRILDSNDTIILNSNDSNSPKSITKENVVNTWSQKLGDHTLQIVGLTFIIPTILMVAVATKLNSDAVTALLGSMIGYLFGSSRSTENKPAPPPAPPAAETGQQPTTPPTPSPPSTGTGEPLTTPPAQKS
jgi:hypothetical protein